MPSKKKPTWYYVNEFWLRVEKSENGCWNWTGSINQKGYGSFASWFQGIRYWRAHRFAYALFNDHPDSELQVCHDCDNRACVNPDHLYEGTNQDNVDDRHRRGRTGWGEKARTAKLTDSDVIKIRSSDKSNDELAKHYGVHPSTIYNARTGRKWKHLPLMNGDPDNAD